LDLKSQALELVNNLNGRMGPSPYDIAWMARVPADADGGPRWPELINWLTEHQWLDGSWGGSIRYYHDRILCTLAAIIALKEHGTDHEITEAIERGERYIWHNLHRLRHDPFEMVGFELILPTLLIEATDLGLDVPKHTCGYGRIRQEKLRLIPPKLLYSPKVTTVHSLEFLGKDGDSERMQQALAVNGSLGNSPATTSYYVLQGGDDDQALAYLHAMLDHNGHVIYLHPFRAFELAWVLHSLSSCQEPLINLVDDSVWKQLQDNLGEYGTGLDPTFGIEDSDTTSVTMLLLRLAGYSADPTILARFEDTERHIFRTYDYERNVSISTNIHALEALSVLPNYPNREQSRDRILALLLAHRTFDTYWVDKWHASPYYATAHVLSGISKTAPRMLDECRRTVEWLTHTQREDGSWGFFDQGTAEETAYALTALLHSSRRFPINKDLFKQGADFLYREVAETTNRLEDYHYPPLWLGKPLYVPRDIVQASVLSALILYEETFGSL
jgi:halimadienyl-diphosphate synthase